MYSWKTIQKSSEIDEGKFAISAKKWIRFKTHQIDPKSHEDHEYLIHFGDSSVAEELSVLPVHFGKISIFFCLSIVHTTAL
jgi:hypothetical protein